MAGTRFNYLDFFFLQRYGCFRDHILHLVRKAYTTDKVKADCGDVYIVALLTFSHKSWSCYGSFRGWIRGDQPQDRAARNAGWGVDSNMVLVRSRPFGAGNEIDAFCVLVTTLELINTLSDRASNGLQP